MYSHICKDGKVIQLPNHAKNAIDSTIKNNERVKKRLKTQRKEIIYATVDKGLYEIQGAPISYGTLPRKK